MNRLTVNIFEQNKIIFINFSWMAVILLQATSLVTQIFITNYIGGGQWSNGRTCTKGSRRTRLEFHNRHSYFIKQESNPELFFMTPWFKWAFPNCQSKYVYRS